MEVRGSNGAFYKVPARGGGGGGSAVGGGGGGWPAVPAGGRWRRWGEAPRRAAEEGAVRGEGRWGKVSGCGGGGGAAAGRGVLGAGVRGAAGMERGGGGWGRW